MRAILIDPFTQSVQDIVIEERGGDACLHDILAAVGCDTLDAFRIRPYRDVVWVDDWCLLRNGVTHAFSIPGYPQVMPCRGVVTGADPAGETVEPRISTSALRSVVRWYTAPGAP